MSRYADLKEYAMSLSLDELAITLRRQSQGFSRGSSFNVYTHAERVVARFWAAYRHHAH